MTKTNLVLTIAWSITAACGASPAPGTPAQPTPPAAPVSSPPTTAWQELAPMPSGVGESAVAVLAGKVYVAGGFDTRKTVSVYELEADRWQLGAELPAGTDNAGAVAVGDQLYVIGGEGNAVLRYDPATATWSRGPALPAPRFASVVELLEGEIHLVGGWSFRRSNNVSVATHDAFDVATGTYRSRAPAPTARNHAFSGVIGGKLYVTGGRGPGHEGDDASNLTATEVYDPVTDSWRALADLPTPRSGGASAVLDGKLYVLGGGLPGDEVHATVERYDPATDQWERLADLPVAVTGHRAVAFAGSLYVVGGFATADGKRQGIEGSARVFRFTPPR